MKYTINQFKKDFPNDDVCLDYIFRTRFPEKTGYYRINTTKSYSNAAGHHIFPLAGTIFEQSTTPLTLWFFAIYLFSTSKNGVSAAELQRQLGVTYKTAWRIASQIRKLMASDGDKLTGIVEIDEAHIGDAQVLGAVERGGNARAKVVEAVNGSTIGTHVVQNVAAGSKLMSDGANTYAWLDRHYERQAVNHSKEYVNGDVHVNSMEAFWSQVKRSIAGTHHSVSVKHLQSYVDFFVFQHGARFSAVAPFWALLGRACV